MRLACERGGSVAERLRLWIITGRGEGHRVVEAWLGGTPHERASVAAVMPLLAHALDRWAAELKSRGAPDP